MCWYQSLHARKPGAYCRCSPGSNRYLTGKVGIGCGRPMIGWMPWPAHPVPPPGNCGPLRFARRSFRSHVGAIPTSSALTPMWTALPGGNADGIDPLGTIFFFVGCVDREKRLDALLLTFSALLQREDLQLVIGGKGANQNKLAALANGLGLGAKVHF